MEGLGRSVGGTWKAVAGSSTRTCLRRNQKQLEQSEAIRSNQEHSHAPETMTKRPGTLRPLCMVRRSSGSAQWQSLAINGNQ